MRNSSDRFVNKIETRVLCSQLFFRESYRLWRNMEKYGTARAATDDNIIRSDLHADNYDKNTDTHSWYFVLIIVNSCTICFVVRQQSKDNLLLNFHRNSEHILLTATSTPNAITRGLFLRFRGNNDYANAPQCNVVRTSSCSHSVSAQCHGILSCQRSVCCSGSSRRGGSSAGHLTVSFAFQCRQVLLPHEDL
jgi:hypothetical protein